MAELNLNYDPAWLQQRPDSNQPMSLAEAFQLKQRQQQLDTEKALLPLRQQELQARIANEALDHTIKQEQIDYALKAKAGSAEVWNQISKTDWSNPGDVSNLWSTVAKVGVVEPQALRVIEANQRISGAAERKLMESEAKVATADLYAASREKISSLQIQAAKERTDAAIASRETIAKDNREARAELQLLRENRKLLNIGKQVTWPEFLNRTMGTYVRNTGKTPEEAAPALRKIYDDYIAIPEGESTAPANPKDPASLFTP